MSEEAAGNKGKGLSDKTKSAGGSKERLTALVAESDRALRELLRLHLHNAGYNVILAPDAVVAGRTILERPQAIDVLIIATQLPYMSGTDFVATLIADSSLRFIPTVMIATREQDASHAEVLGVPSLIVPFSAQQLLSVVDATIDRTQPKPVQLDPPRRSMRQRLDDLTVPIPVPTGKRPLRIVVADDEPDTVRSLVAILNHEGHNVFGSQRAPEVLPEVRANKPDAVILDIDMPGISGFAIAREIRELYGDASPLLVAVSGKWVGQTDRMLAQLAGFDHFLQKPCHPDSLLSVLEGRPVEPGRQGGFECGPSPTFPI